MTNWYWQREADSIVLYEGDETKRGLYKGDHYIAEINGRRLALGDLALAVHRATEIVDSHNAKGKVPA